MSEEYTYTAFLSYSHKDRKLGAWLHRQLENYRIPKNLVGRETSLGPVPPRLGKIFRDRDELPVTDDLTAEVQKALAASRYMVVLCSPASAASRWVNKEIIEFKKLRGDKYVLPLIIGGEPYASKTGMPEEECFPPAVRFKLGPNGLLSAIELEPAAADLRREADGKRRAVLKLIAGLVGVGLDQLVERDLRRRHRKVMLVTAGSVAGMIAMSVLTVEAISARRAADRNRGEAEDLIEFMLTDLRKQLAPVGRLDALDAVGEKVLEYYDKQAQHEEIPDNSIGRQARAYHLLGEMQHLRDKPDSATELFNRSAEATAELLRRDPLNTQRIFEHAQSVFWVADQAYHRGNQKKVEEGYREYKRLADLLVELEPDNLDWQIEVAYGNLNMGIVHLRNYKNPREALSYFERALIGFEKAYKKRSEDARLLSDISNTLVWMHDCLKRTADVSEVQKNLTALEKYIQIAFDQDAKSQFAKEWQMGGYIYRALNYRDTGNHKASLELLEKAISDTQEWIDLEPEAITPHRFKISALIHLSITCLYLGLTDQADEYLNLIPWDNVSDTDGQGGEWEAAERFRGDVIRINVAMAQEDYAQAGKLLSLLNSQEILHQSEFLKSQKNMYFLLKYYSLKIEYLLKTDDFSTARYLAEQVWGMIDKDDLDKFPSVLKNMKHIADLVGDAEVSERVEKVLHERGYIGQGGTPVSHIKTIN